MRQLEAWTKAHPRLAAWVVLGAILDGVVAFDCRSLRLGRSRVGLLLLATTCAAAIAVRLVEWE
ncbi:MAG: hypothetical protein ABSG98_02535 [Anaerolineales bacterium]|jgi:hypothetical protein